LQVLGGAIAPLWIRTCLEMVKVTYWCWICWWNCKVAKWIWLPIL